MNSTGVFTNDMAVAIDSESNISDAISYLLDMIDYSKEYSTNYFVHEDSLYSQNISGVDFVNWLYDRSDAELRDIKRELQIRICQSETFEKDIELASILSQSDTFSIGKPFPCFVWSIYDFLIFKQNRLKKIDAKSKFAQELAECYKNIFFDSGVSASMNTLNNSFVNIRDEIVFHLYKLDSYFEKFKTEIHAGCSSKEFSLSFNAFSGIECSPQAGRDTVKNLKRTYENNVTKAMEEIVCELHTKFTTHNRDATKQDRIYFHSGRPNLCDGKIIVIHIGTHQ